MEKKIKIVAICGSLRKGSYNMAVLKEIDNIIDENFSYKILDLSNLPLFNEDLESNLPEEIINFKEKLRDADAILIGAPEYNSSISGVLKNALDWASRGDKPPLVDKPCGIISASIGSFGGVRAQGHLRQILLSLNLNVLNRPEVFIPGATDKFNQDLKLTDERAINSLKKMIAELINETKKDL